jgi:hypothetical protein
MGDPAHSATRRRVVRMRAYSEPRRTRPFGTSSRRVGPVSSDACSAVERVDAVGDPLRVPARAVLVLQRDQLSGRVHACPSPRVGEHQQREQAEPPWPRRASAARASGPVGSTPRTGPRGSPHRRGWRCGPRCRRGRSHAGRRRGAPEAARRAARRNGIAASVTLRRARVRRPSMASSLDTNARAISGTVRPATLRSVSAIRASGGSSVSSPRTMNSTPSADRAAGLAGRVSSRRDVRAWAGVAWP